MFKFSFGYKKPGPGEIWWIDVIDTNERAAKERAEEHVRKVGKGLLYYIGPQITPLT